MIPLSLSDGHRGRLREKFARSGATGFHDYELLELLLTFAVPRRDVKPIAKALLERFRGLAEVLDATEAELRSVEGVGAASAALLRLVRELCACASASRMAGRDLLLSPERVAEFARARIGGLPHEAFLVIYVNVQNEVLHSEILNEGTIDQVTVYPRRVIEGALARHAAGFILAHNHPSGYVQPSDEDKTLTRAIERAAQLLSIRVLDHVIVGRGGSYSFRAWNLLEV
jgi:DNA repair protein RadC